MDRVVCGGSVASSTSGHGGDGARARRRDACDRRPFAETKEFIAGFDVLDCADLDEAFEVEAKNPVAQFHPFELRPFLDGLRLGPGRPRSGRATTPPAARTC